MAHIAIVTSHPPFAVGGHLVIAQCLRDGLREVGHTVDVLMTPQNRFGRQGSAYLATRLTDVGLTHDGRTVDQVITLRFPSYAVRHPAHVCWLNHRMREYYDLWPRFSASLGVAGRMKERVRRRVIHGVDHYLLTRNVTRLYAQSRTIQQRLIRYGGIRSAVIQPPPPPRPYRCERADGYIFVVSRLTPLKRIDLVIRALATPDGRGARCVVAGDGEAAGTLAELGRSLGVDDRLEFLGHVDEATLVDRMAHCAAVCFAPLAEDYGFVTAEAFASGKPVITCTDSGGPAELVEDRVTGFVCDPTPESVAGALRAVMDDPDRAEQMGQAGRALVAPWTWPDVARRLVIV